MTPDPLLHWLGLPVAASAHAGEVDRIMVLVHWLMLTLFIGWSIFFIYVLLRFRRAAHPRADYGGVTPKRRAPQRRGRGTSMRHRHPSTRPRSCESSQSSSRGMCITRGRTVFSGAPTSVSSAPTTRSAWIVRKRWVKTISSSTTVSISPSESR